MEHEQEKKKEPCGLTSVMWEFSPPTSQQTDMGRRKRALSVTALKPVLDKTTVFHFFDPHQSCLPRASPQGNAVGREPCSDATERKVRHTFLKYLT